MNKHPNQYAISVHTLLQNPVGYDDWDVFKDAIRTERSDVALVFEVYAGIIKDGEGNDVQVFIKEDKANGLRRNLFSS